MYLANNIHNCQIFSLFLLNELLPFRINLSTKWQYYRRLDNKFNFFTDENILMGVHRRVTPKWYKGLLIKTSYFCTPITDF